ALCPEVRPEAPRARQAQGAPRPVPGPPHQPRPHRRRCCRDRGERGQRGAERSRGHPDGRRRRHRCGGPVDLGGHPDGRGARPPRRAGAGLTVGPPGPARRRQGCGAVGRPGARRDPRGEPRRRGPPRHRPRPPAPLRLRLLPVLVPRLALRQRVRLARRRGQPHLVGVRHPAGADPAARPAGRLHDLGRVPDPVGPRVHPGHLRHPVLRLVVQAGQQLVL
ncbi:MAG: Secreted protein precursor, partial [uncultured Nocardioides sp.]